MPKEPKPLREVVAETLKQIYFVPVGGTDKNEAVATMTMSAYTNLKEASQEQ